MTETDPAHAAKTEETKPETEKYPKGATFQPRVEAEEGEPTCFDYVVLVLVALFIVLATLWAFGVITIPGLSI